MSKYGFLLLLHFFHCQTAKKKIKKHFVCGPGILLNGFKLGVSTIIQKEKKREIIFNYNIVINVMKHSLKGSLVASDECFKH